MTTQILTLKSIEALVNFEKEARATEPDVFTGDFDACKYKAETESVLKNSNFFSARCIICVNEESKVIGRIDFSIVSSFSFGGNIQVYVDWIYVLKEFRHQGIAQLLFSQMEAYIEKMGINEYFLLMAKNAEAQNFYRNMVAEEIENHDILRKRL